MRYLFITNLVLSLFLLVAPAALAQEPTPTVPADTGYDFQQYDFESVNTVDISEELAVFSEPQFVNPMGSTAVSIWGMINASNVMSIFVVLLLGLAVVWWVYGRVTNGAVPTTHNGGASGDNPYRPRSRRGRRR